MTSDFVAQFIVPAALSLLPKRLDTPEARAMLIAIGLQESAFLARRQMTSKPGYAPARGFWQFEVAGGTAAVLVDDRTRVFCEVALRQLRYPPAAVACWEAFEHNDILACLFARLFLLTSPLANPGPDDAEIGWHIYESTWRPGAPRPNDWPANFARAWAIG